jgi:hypothetical protein
MHGSKLVDAMNRRRQWMMTSMCAPPSMWPDVAFAQNPRASALVIKRMAYLIAGRKRSDEQNERQLMEWIEVRRFDDSLDDHPDS